MFIAENGPSNRQLQQNPYGPPPLNNPYSQGSGLPSLFPPLGYSNAPPPSFHQPARHVPNELPRHASVNENKSFIDGFDNNASSLSQQKSHARNLKRLFNNQDPVTEKVKENKVRSYREELQRQMEETKERKRIEKQKIEAEELARERKFYEQFKIQAQQKGKDDRNPEGDFLTMMRTAQNYKKKNQSPVTTEPADNLKNTKIYKRGGYHNQSSLGQFQKTRDNLLEEKSSNNDSPRPREKKKEQFRSIDEEVAREKMIEEDRINKLLFFQQRVLQKITDIKSEIRNSGNVLDTEKQLARVRNSLRARRSHIEDPADKSPAAHRGNNSINHFYSLPRRSSNVAEPQSRYGIRLKDLSSANNGKKKGNQFMDSFQSSLTNDKNILESPQKDEDD